MVNGGGNKFTDKKADFDSVNIADIELAMSVINKLPYVREERVKEVKEKYSDLDYEEDAENIADKILEKFELKRVSELYQDESDDKPE